MLREQYQVYFQMKIYTIKISEADLRNFEEADEEISKLVSKGRNCEFLDLGIDLIGLNTIIKTVLNQIEKY